MLCIGDGQQLNTQHTSVIVASSSTHIRSVKFVLSVVVKSSLLLLRTIIVSLSAKPLYIDGRTTFERNNKSPAVAYTRLVGEASTYHKIIVAAFPVPLGP